MMGGVTRSRGSNLAIGSLVLNDIKRGREIVMKRNVNIRIKLMVFAVAAIMCTFFTVTTVWAQYPDRAIDFIVNWGAGGGADQFARTIGPLVEQELDVPIPVSNMPGASGNTGLAKLTSSKSDGYTICTMTGVTFSTIAGGKSPFKIKDFDWLVRAQYTPSMLFVPANSPFKTVDDLFSNAKKNPNKITVGTDGFGTPADLTLKFLSSKGISMKNIPFDKPAERYLSPVAGHVDVLYEEPGDVRAFLDAGKIKPLILFAEKRLTTFPNVVTSYEKGLPVSIPNWRGIVLKKGASAEQIQLLATAFKNAMKTDKWKAFCSKKYSCDDDPLTLQKFEQWVIKQQELRN